MESLITTFHIDWKIILAQAINFGIVFSVLFFFAIKPLRKIMAERTVKISQSLDDAKANAEMLKSTKEEYEKILAEARTEANNIFQDTKKAAEVKKEEMLADAKSQVATMIEAGKKNLESEKNKMMEEVKIEIVQLTVSSVTKILKETSNGKIDEQIIKNISNLS